MKITYVANMRVPTEGAHGIQIMEMCQAFSRLGADVVLVVRNSESNLKKDIFSFYDIQPIFTLKKVWCLDVVRFGKLGFLLESVTFAISTILYSINKNHVFYTRDEMIAFFLKLMGKRVIWEAHMGHKNPLIRFLVYINSKTVVISDSLKHLYVSMGLDPARVLVAPDGVDIDRFDIDVTKGDARQKLGLPLEKKIVLYKGSLIPYKGVGTLAEATQYIRSPDVQTVVIGGSFEELEDFRKQYGDKKNLFIVGYVPRTETPIYQKAADILVIPNSAKEEMSKFYTSPIKLFGYMASSVPIVASDLPSIREVLDDSSAYFFTPDDSKSLAETIDKVIGDPDADTKASTALEEVKKYSWKNRAERIIAFIEK